MTVPAPTCYHECEKLQPDTGYDFAVSAVNSAGESENVTVFGNTTCSPDPPTVETGRAIHISLGGSCSARYVRMSIPMCSILSIVVHVQHCLPTAGCPGANQLS